MSDPVALAKAIAETAACTALGAEEVARALAAYDDEVRRLTYGRADLMTDAEHRAMDLTAQLWNLLAGEVIANGPAGPGDRAELAAAVHVIQRMVLGQAAARAYPDRYRLLGGWPAGQCRCELPDVTGRYGPPRTTLGRADPECPIHGTAGHP